jgi:hypothetical protein
MGGQLSKWTISYFAVSIAWLIGAEGLMVAGYGFPSADIAAPDTLVVVHMVCIGWLSMAMCGALFQFVPVLVAKPLYAENWTLAALVLLTVGLTALLAGFLALGGRLPSWSWLLPVGALLLIAGFAVVALDLALTLWTARPLPQQARFVGVGLLAVTATVLLGGTFSLALSGQAIGPLASAMLASGVPIHAIAGLGGWLTLTAMGVSYRLLSMFMLSPDPDPRKSRITLLAGSTTLTLAVVGGVFAIAVVADLSLVLSLAAAAGLLTLGFYGRDIRTLYAGRKRRTLELNTRMAVWSFASLAGAAALGLALALAASFVLHVGAVVFLVVFGWLSGLILANLYKIVPFLTWLETYGPVMGRTATPRVQDLVAERRASKWFALFFVSTWAATAALLAQQQFVFRATAVAMAVATLCIVQEFVRARRLADVAEKLRLPAGVCAPHLLFSRS